MDIKDFIKIDNEKAKRAFSESINPKRDWYIITTVFIVLLFAVIIFSILLYLGAKKGSIFADLDKKGEEAEVINKEQLMKNVYNFQSRSETFETIKNVNSIDPSL